MDSDYYQATTMAMAFIMLTHGGVGYVQSKPIVLLGMLILASLSGWWLVCAGLRLTFAQLNIIAATTLLMYVSAMIAMITLGTKTGFVFLAINVTTLWFFSQLVKRYADASGVFICSAFIVAAAVSAVLAILLYIYPLQVAGLQFGRQGYFRLVGIFSTPNRFGEAVALGALAATHLFLIGRRRRFLHGMLAGTFFIATLASGSKGVILGLLPALLAMVTLLGAWKKKIFLTGSAVLLSIAAFLLYWYYEFFLLAAKINKIEEGVIDIGSGRMAIWGKGEDLFLSAPLVSQLFGHGATGFLSLIGVDAHSMYWNMLIDSGLISLLALLVFVAYVVVLLIVNKIERPLLVFGFSLIVFCLLRGISMPTILKEFNFSMLGFWAGVAIMFCSVRRGYIIHD